MRAKNMLKQCMNDGLARATYFTLLPRPMRLTGIQMLVSV